MTISSHPGIKLLVSVIVAIVVGVTLDSWGWGIAAFSIAMFLFIWVADWIFGGPIKGKIEVTEELDFLLDRLQLIGNKKNELPLNARGWCNSLGLFVQLREMGNMTRLLLIGLGKEDIDEIDRIRFLLSNRKRFKKYFKDLKDFGESIGEHY